MPVSLSLDLVGDAPSAACFETWRARLHAVDLIVELLHLQTVILICLLAKGRRRATLCADAFLCETHKATFAILHHLCVFSGSTDSTSTITARVVLGRRQVHLILVGSSRLDHTRWLPNDLLVGQDLALLAPSVAIPTCMAHLRVISEAQIELARVELHHIGRCTQFLSSKSI